MSQKSEDQNREFYCFISYKHRDGDKFMLDEEWAEALAFSLSQLHIPAETKPPIIDDAFINLNPKDDVVYPVFRDFEVLGAGSKFSDRIVLALKHSRKLVVVISDEMIEDQEKLVNRKISCDKEERYLNAWCYREIFCFLQNHTSDDIILLYIGSKKDIREILPSVLTGGIRKRDVDNKELAAKLTAKQKAEYSEYIKYWKPRNIAIVYPNGVEKSVKELRDFYAAKIAANIFGTDPDQFRNYQMAEEEKRLAEKKKNLLQKVFGAVIALIVISVLIVSRQITTSQVNLAKARTSLSEGNRKDAMTYALDAYKQWHSTPGLTQFMWDALEPKESFMAFDSDVAVSPSRNEFAATRDNQYVDVYDGSSLRVLATYDVGHGGNLVYSQSGSKLAVFTNKEISVLDRDSASIVYDQRGVWSKDGVRFSPDGEYIFRKSDGVYRTDNLQQLVLRPMLPYQSYKVTKDLASFLGTNNRVAIIRQISEVSGKNASDSLWTISVYDLSKQGEGARRSRLAEFYYEFPDSVSFVHAYNNVPLIFATSNCGISFFRNDEKGLTKIGWRRYDSPVYSGYREEWPELPYKINSIVSLPSGDCFILHSDRGVSFRLDSKSQIRTVVSAIAYQNGDISTYRGKVLAVDDSLNLAADDYGHLFLLTRIDPDDHGKLNPRGAVPLSGLTHGEGRDYSISGMRNFQFVSQSRSVVSGKQTRTLMFWNKDTREIPTLKNAGRMWCKYTSPDLRFAIVVSGDEFGVFDSQDKAFIPVCSTSLMSSKQDKPMYVSKQGDDVYVLSAKRVSTPESKDKYGLVRVNLPSKTASVVVEDMDDFSEISEGVVIGKSLERTYLVDLRRKIHIEEYAGWIDIRNDNGRYSVSKRIPLSENSSSIEPQPLLYDSSTASLIPAPDSTGVFSSSPLGSYCIKETSVQGTKEYDVYDLHSLNHIVTITSNLGTQSIAGISDNERYFIYGTNGRLSIFDFKTKKEINTTYRINAKDIWYWALASEHMFFLSNTYRVIELNSGKTIATVPELQSDNWEVCFSPDENWMLAGQYLVNIEEGTIVSASIPAGYNRLLSNENIVYHDKRMALPRKKALAKQISTILKDELGQGK